MFDARILEEALNALSQFFEIEHARGYRGFELSFRSHRHLLSHGVLQARSRRTLPVELRILDAQSIMLKVLCMVPESGPSLLNIQFRDPELKADFAYEKMQYASYQENASRNAASAFSGSLAANASIPTGPPYPISLSALATKR